MSNQIIHAQTCKQDEEHYSRRQILSGAAKVAALGTVGAALGGCAPAGKPEQENLIGTRCMTILYPNGDDITFDFDYYKNRHLTLIMDLYGKSIRRFELRKGLPGPDGSKPTYVATINIWIADLQAFGEAGEKHSQTLIDDVPNFTNGFPVIQADEVYEIAES